MYLIHCRYTEGLLRDFKLHERNDDSEHCVVYDAWRRILFINPSVEVLDDKKELRSEGALQEWFASVLWELRGIYFAPTKSSAKRVRQFMLKTWMPERQHCTGYHLMHQFPPLA